MIVHVTKTRIFYLAKVMVAFFLQRCLIYSWPCCQVVNADSKC